MGPNPRIWMALLLLATGSAAARAQAVVEYGSGAGASASAAASNRKTGKQIGGVWNALDKTLQSSSDAPSRKAQSRRAARKAAAPAKKESAPEVPAAAAVHEDPSRIQPGIPYEEVVRRCGTPSFEVATGPATRTLAYSGKEGSVDVELRDGKVIRVAEAK